MGNYYQFMPFVVVNYALQGLFGLKCIIKFHIDICQKNKASGYPVIISSIMVDQLKDQVLSLMIFPHFKCQKSQVILCFSPNFSISKFFSNFTIDKGVLLGCVLFAVGGIVSVIAAIDLYKYMMNAEEILFQVETTKWGFMAITLVILGIQTVISSFYLCLFNIKQIYHN